MSNAPATGGGVGLPQCRSILSRTQPSRESDHLIAAIGAYISPVTSTRYFSYHGAIILFMNPAPSIALLNQSVADELLAVHQYMYFHIHLDDQGFAPLATLFKRTAITEMGHVEALAERILFLKGDVEMSLAAPVEKIADPAAMLAKARQMEESSANAYNQAALECAICWARPARWRNPARTPITRPPWSAPRALTPPPSRSSSGSLATKKATSPNSTASWKTSNASARATWRCSLSRRRQPAKRPSISGDGNPQSPPLRPATRPLSHTFRPTTEITDRAPPACCTGSSPPALAPRPEAPRKSSPPTRAAGTSSTTRNWAAQPRRTRRPQDAPQPPWLAPQSLLPEKSPSGSRYRRRRKESQQ